MERVSDYCENISEYAEELKAQNVSFSGEGAAELKEMLFRQLFDFVGKNFTFRPDMFHVGMLAEFDGMQSVAAFFWGSTSFSVSKEVLVNLPYLSVQDWGFRYYQNIAEDESSCLENK